DGDVREVERWCFGFRAREAALHLRRFAEEQRLREVDGMCGAVGRVGIDEDNFEFGGGAPDDGEGAALACAEEFEEREVFGWKGEDVALLRFVAPDFEWREAGL